MADLPITLTCADYARVLPLAAGLVPTPGISLTMILGRAGSWTDRAEMLRRATQDSTVAGGESSMAQHLYRIARGDRSHIALPVFPLRNLPGRDFYVRAGSDVRSLADLRGRRVGTYSVSASGSIWYRHFLRWAGVANDSIEWWVGNIDAPWGLSATGMPPGTKQAPEGRSLAQMLIDGEIDAITAPPRPKDYHPKNGPIARLLPDFPTVEAEYWRQTRCFAPQHLITLRREVWQANPWIARALTDAFIACEAEFTASQRSFPYATPWLEAEIEHTVAVMGEAYHPHGLPACAGEIDAFCAEAHLLGLTDRRVTVEEYFAEFLES
jgi:4,5-dihydroxyphthalate decarboxylase